MLAMSALPEVQVIPVLDLLSGQVVRAVRGDRSAYRPIVSTLADGSDARVIATALLERCAMPGSEAVLYIADLDAIQGRPGHTATLARLLDALPGLTLWLDAGFADVPTARAALAALGANAVRVRPVFGSESLRSAAALAAVCEEPGAILSLDSKKAQAIDPSGSWERPELWPDRVIVMTLDRVGAGSGPDLEMFARLRAKAPGRRWVGAGGVRNALDLAQAQRAGAHAWLVASALHDGSLDPRRRA
jgi:uncharacterized protein related to proFAR isomerase